MPEPFLQPPDFLVLGHVTRDIVGDELRPGGTASYASAVAARLGLRTAIFTSTGDDFLSPPELAGVAEHRLPATRTTVMEHRWYGRRRDQFRRSSAARLSAASVPPALRDAAIVLAGPVTDELDADVLGAFLRALRGATIQGWLRSVGADGHVETLAADAWAYAPVLERVQAAFLSDEDLGGDLDAVLPTLDLWSRTVPILVVTRGDAGARISVGGIWYEIAAMPARELDGTGAGDAFAAGFLIRYHETADAAEAARFAAAVASFVVEAPGIAGAPARRQVDARLAAHPDVRLRRIGGSGRQR